MQDGVGWSASGPGRFTPEKENVWAFYRTQRGLKCRSGRVRKIWPPSSFQSPERPARSEALHHSWACLTDTKRDTRDSTTIWPSSWCAVWRQAEKQNLLCGLIAYNVMLKLCYGHDMTAGMNVAACEYFVWLRRYDNPSRRSHTECVCVWVCVCVCARVSVWVCAWMCVCVLVCICVNEWVSEWVSVCE